jgi:hypothetical protein
MLCRVTLVITDVSEELITYINRSKRIGKLGKTSSIFLHSGLRLLVIANVVPRLSILVNLMMQAIHSSETSVLTSAKRRNIPGDGILYSHRRDNLKF